MASVGREETEVTPKDDRTPHAEAAAGHPSPPVDTRGPLLTLSRVAFPFTSPSSIEETSPSSTGGKRSFFPTSQIDS